MPLGRQQFNRAVQYVNTTTSPHTTGEACKAAIEACTPSLLRPLAMCELVLNLRAPKSSWRTLSELYKSTIWSTTAPFPVAPTRGPFAPSRTSKPANKSW